jgi:hypothetical protein
MIAQLLDRYGKTAAAGILARAALSLGYDSPSISDGKDALQIQTGLIEEARKSLGLSEDDNREEAIEKIGSFLDDQAEKLSAPPDTAGALARLAQRGDLPSDLYEINIIPNVVDLYGPKFQLEREIIETTIRDPANEQHYGPVARPFEPAMISVFVRPFRTKWPMKDFVMLVAGQRDGFYLNVHQAWRLYPSRVDMAHAKSPVELLERFANAFGSEIKTRDAKGYFFLYTDSLPDRFEIDPSKGPVFFSLSQPGIPRAGALVVAIDIWKYRKMLTQMSVKRSDFLERFAGSLRGGTPARAG